MSADAEEPNLKPINNQRTAANTEGDMGAATDCAATAAQSENVQNPGSEMRESFDSMQFLSEATEPRARNSDDVWLGAVSAGPFTIGHVDYVNGFGAQEIAGFVPTRHELMLLAKHWAEEALDIEYFCFLYQMNGSNLTRKRNFAWRRVNRIEQLLGEEAVGAAVQEVIDAMGKRYSDSRHWRAFLHGTDEERSAVQEEIAQEMSRSACTSTSEAASESQN